MKKLKNTLILTIIIIFCFNLFGCKKQNAYYSYDYFNCYSVIKVDNAKQKDFNDFISKSEDLLAELNLQFSTTVGDVYNINNANINQPIPISENTYKILEKAKILNQLTNNKFNPAIYPVSRLWNFTPDTYQGVDYNYTLPTAEEIQLVLQKTDYTSLSIYNENGYYAVKESDIEIDLGGIAKGYAIDKLALLYKGYDLGDGYISLGSSSIAVFGKKTIAIKNPLLNSENETFFELTTNDETYISTSGNYERYYTINGTTYGHIIDPVTGCPSNNDVISATVIGDPIYGDALSTALINLSKADAINFVNEKLTDFKVVLVVKSPNGVEVLTNLTSNFTLTESSFNLVKI
jgi:thiamine biosynthesis lipoprotein